MPLNKEEMIELSEIYRAEGDEENELLMLNQIADLDLEGLDAADQSVQPQGLEVSKAQGNDPLAILETIATMASSFPAQVAGGVAGLGGALVPGEEGQGARVAKTVQDALTYTPQTQAGDAMLRELTETPPIAALSEGMENYEQAAEVAGQSVAGATGSNVLGTAIETGVKALPDLAELFTGLKVAGTARKSAMAGAQDVASKVKVAPSKRKVELLELIEESVPDRDIAALKAVDYDTLNPFQKAAVDLEIYSPTVQKSAQGQRALDSGYSKGSIASAVTANSADNALLKDMLKIKEKGLRNNEYAVFKRPSDVAGNKLLEQIKFLDGRRKATGAEIDRVATGLKGQPVDISNAVGEFDDAIEALGIRLVNGKDGLKADYSKSILPASDRKAVSEIIRQMGIHGGGAPDAYSVHRMKRIIDNNIKYGSNNVKGISADAEGALRGFRRSLDDALDGKFPDYDNANKKYAELKTVLDESKSAFKADTELSDIWTDRALGVALRGMTSNTAGGAAKGRAVGNLSKAFNKFGGSGDTNIIKLMDFADELDTVLRPSARTSLQGELAKSSRRSQALDAGVDMATTGGVSTSLSSARKVKNLFKKERDIEKEALDSMRELLKQNTGKSKEVLNANP